MSGRTGLTAKMSRKIHPYPADSNPKYDAGFTLLEILIAIFIFAVIVTTLFGSYNLVFSNVKNIHEGMDVYEMAKNCLNRMILDLESVHVSRSSGYKPPEFDEAPDPYRIVGDSSYSGDRRFSKLRFTSLAHLPLEKHDRGGIAEIVYYVQADDARGYVLKRADTLYPYEPFEEKGIDPVLCEGVKSLSFTYYDHEGREHELWDSDSDEYGYATPRAIRIRLEVGDESSAKLFETMVTIPVSREKKEGGL